MNPTARAVKDLKASLPSSALIVYNEEAVSPQTLQRSEGAKTWEEIVEISGRVSLRSLIFMRAFPDAPHLRWVFDLCRPRSERDGETDDRGS